MSETHDSTATVDAPDQMRIERVSIEQVSPDPANVRTHDDRNLEAIKASLVRFGQQKPIVVGPDGVVIAGNGTLAAAKALGWPSIDVVRTELVGAEATAYAIADNRTAELATWDDEPLAKMLAKLRDDPSIDELATGFSQREIEKLIGKNVRFGDEADSVPDPPKDPVTKPGDLWALGDHRLLCGDSVHVDVEFDKLAAVITDPPYIIGAVSVGNAKTKSGSWHDMMNAADWYSSWYKNWWHRLGVGFLASFGNWRTLPSMIKAAADANISMQSCLVWDKEWIGPGSDNMLRPQYEICTIAAKSSAVILNRSLGDVVRMKWHGGAMNTTGHAAEKPVDIYGWLISALTKAGNTIADPFAGSGTALIAAEQLNRRCYGIEISPAYCDVIVARWEALTGQKADRERP